VLRQTFRAPFGGKPSLLFQRIQVASPSPYEFYIQFGDEQLIGASPEMYVRVEGRRVETSPISGTAPRRPMQDAAIRTCFPRKGNPTTMCADVDNDKSRVSVPVGEGGRRLIEALPECFTVDHVESTLAEVSFARRILTHA
jgi:anthranilate synthase